MAYTLPLTEPRVKQHQVTSLHLISGLSFLTAGAIVYVYIFTMKPQGAAIFVAGLLLAALTMGKNKWLTTPRTSLIFRFIELAISSYILVEAVMHHEKFPSIIFGILDGALLAGIYMENFASNILTLYVDDAGIMLPSPARQRLINWYEVEHAILKDNVLSVNCVNNHFYQWNIRPNSADSNDFDTYCAKMVADNEGKRPKNDW